MMAGRTATPTTITVWTNRHRVRLPSRMMSPAWGSSRSTPCVRAARVSESQIPRGRQRLARSPRQEIVVGRCFPG